MKTIVLNGDYGFLDKIETTIKSIIYHNQRVKIYVINPDIPHEWFINLNQYLNQIGSQIIDKKIDQEYLNEVNSSFRGIKNIAFARVLIPEVIKENKVLYLDCDIVVNANLDELFNIDLENKWVYGVRDYQVPSEFNSGMLLINNKKWKESNLVSSLLEKAKASNLRNGDQTVINEVFKNKIEELDPSYNYQIGFEKAAFWGNLQKTTLLLDKIKNPKIIHFITEDKPFNLVSVNSLRNKWWHYNRLEWSEIISKYGSFDKSRIKNLSFDGEVFLFTRMAEIQNIEQLIKKLPNIRFNIAAYTPMAFLLLKLTQYDNVRLFPTIIGKTLDKEIDQADVYLDINYGPKADEVVEKIVQKNIPIFAFDQTKSPDLNYDNYQVFHDDQVDEMATAINNTIKTNPKFNIEVKDVSESLDLILENRKSVVRFGDGEFDLIRGDSIPYQDYKPELAEKLKKIILRGNFNNTLVCLPDVFKSLDRYNHYAEDFYNSVFFPKNDHFLKEIAQTNNWYGSTFISRPYIDLVDKSKSTETFTKLKQLWQGRDLLIVEGALTRSGVGNDLFANAKSVKRILCPSKDSYQQIDQIEQAIRANADNRLILLMLGPTAKVVVDDLQDLNNQLIDLGHIDSEYEWFKMGATHKVKLANKHTAEFNYDEDIATVHDQAYQNEIVARIE
ncbi:SP_1767 family glycosyltransferase [Limosilactobacillus reuteri]|uniref:SP_1767 family glycosyltransferase n=1 Tax=Limosilactobacillus reuteri TaxID=1598 RepID=UPI001E3FCB41|nr:SP_1767 family glycosyltransferase [Limosilactobacillus reuteri]MCC4507677.1 SP_1767 family glycosyltransferase [Limosilactobacillus reuteri]